jgi:hypothetical protein
VIEVGAPVTGEPPGGGEVEAGVLPAGRYRVGPPIESDWTRWETELAYLVED